MASKILLVGLASDGPSNEAILATSERELRTLYGASFVERFYVSATTTGCLLAFEPYSMPLNNLGGRKNYLYSPAVSGNYMIFGNPGGSGSIILDLTYTPYLGQQDLVYSARKYIEQCGNIPYVVRIGGTNSTLSLASWKFESKFPGSKYNRLAIVSAGSSFTLTGLEPNYPTLQWTGTVPRDIKNLMERDYNLGLSPIMVSQMGSGILPVGIFFFDNGDDGSFSDTDVAAFFDQTTLPIDVSHIVFLAPLTSSMIDSITDIQVNSDNQPRLYFIQAPGFSGTLSDWITTQNTNLPYRSNMVASVIGTVNSRLDGREVTRYAVEAAAIAFAKKEGYNLTNIPVDATNFSPVLSKTDLILAKSAGWIPLMRYIENDISVYEGVTTYADKSFLYASKVSEIASVAYNYCFQFLGSVLPNGSQPGIVNTLKDLLTTISYITIEDIEVTVIEDSMYVYIQAYLPTEILQISFTIKNR